MIDLNAGETIDQTGGGTVAKINDATTDTVTSIETFIADEALAEADEMTLSGDVHRDPVQGLSDASVGTFNSTGTGPIAFGGIGEPTLNELLAGTYIHPTYGKVDPVGTVQITGGDESGQVGDIAFQDFETTNFSVVCFAEGTLIKTPRGSRRVEDIGQDDMVFTADKGRQPVMWTRAKWHPIERSEDAHYPILISAGALGPNRPETDLIVSPQHRILVGGQEQLEDLFESEQLVPAKSLTSLPRISEMKGRTGIKWVHFALEAHELVLANGCVADSLLLGPMVTNGLTAEENRELELQFGPAPIEGGAMNGEPARPLMGVQKALREFEKARSVYA